MREYNSKETYLVTNRKGFKVKCRLSQTARELKEYYKREIGGEWFVIYDPKGKFVGEK